MCASRREPWRENPLVNRCLLHVDAVLGGWHPVEAAVLFDDRQVLEQQNVSSRVRQRARIAEDPLAKDLRVARVVLQRREDRRQQIISPTWLKRGTPELAYQAARTPSRGSACRRT